MCATTLQHAACAIRPLAPRHELPLPCPIMPSVQPSPPHACTPSPPPAAHAALARLQPAQQLAAARAGAGAPRAAGHGGGAAAAHRGHRHHGGPGPHLPASAAPAPTGESQTQRPLPLPCLQELPLHLPLMAVAAGCWAPGCSGAGALGRGERFKPPHGTLSRRIPHTSFMLHALGRNPSSAAALGAETLTPRHGTRCRMTAGMRKRKGGSRRMRRRGGARRRSLCAEGRLSLGGWRARGWRPRARRRPSRRVAAPCAMVLARAALSHPGVPVFRRAPSHPAATAPPPHSLSLIINPTSPLPRALLLSPPSPPHTPPCRSPCGQSLPATR